MPSETIPQIDLTITISAIVALCAVISPIFTAIINNRYLLKLKKIELKQRELENNTLHERQIYETYLAAAGRCVHCRTNDAESEYGASYYKALMLAPPEWRKAMIDANQKIAVLDQEAANAALESLAPLIHTRLHMQ